jgi:phenylalanyl-tRNA synthetase beta chain
VPAITLNRDRFSKFMGRPFTVEEMVKWLPWLGVDLEEIGSDYVKIEFNPNRVDFCSYAGVARALCGLMGLRTGLPSYGVQKGQITLKVDPSVLKVRPCILGAVVRNLTLDEEAVKELMEMQEDLHWGLGRNRVKVSIGIHDLDKVQPPFTYMAAEPDKIKFVPLDKTEEMDMREILEKHEKGVAFRHILEGATKYPIILDSKGRTLSFPPIINAELTRVTGQTTDLFIDVTGLDMLAVRRSLNVLITALADMGGSIESINVRYPNYTEAAPDLKPQQMTMTINSACKLLGLDLTEAEVIQCLRKCRLDAKKVGRGILSVSIPAYRIDIMHTVDLAEEVAIGYGYYRIKPTKPKTTTTGEPNEMFETANRVRQVMIGLGFTEVMNFILTNEEVHYHKMRQKVGGAVKLANPVSMEYSIIREALLPGLMKNLMDNKHESYPQRLFEVSDVIKIDEKGETGTVRLLHVAGVSSHPTASFTEIKAYVEALLMTLGITDWELNETKNPSFIPGRGAAIYLKGKEVGALGEAHPELLNNFELENPTGAFEIALEEILRNS